METIIWALLISVMSGAFSLGPVMALNQGASTEKVEGLSFLYGVIGSCLLTFIAIVGGVHVNIAKQWGADETVAMLIIAIFIGLAGGALGHLCHENWEKKHGDGDRPVDKLR